MTVTTTVNVPKSSLRVIQQAILDIALNQQAPILVANTWLEAVPINGSKLGWIPDLDGLLGNTPFFRVGPATQVDRQIMPMPTDEAVWDYECDLIYPHVGPNAKNNPAHEDDAENAKQVMRALYQYYWKAGDLSVNGGADTALQIWPHSFKTQPFKGSNLYWLVMSFTIRAYDYQLNQYSPDP